MRCDIYCGEERNALIHIHRFVVGQKICLSISGHHPEEYVLPWLGPNPICSRVCIIRWQPAWSIRTALMALISFMPTEANGAIGSLDYPESYGDVQALSALYRNLSLF